MTRRRNSWGCASLANIVIDPLRECRVRTRAGTQTYDNRILSELKALWILTTSLVYQVILLHIVFTSTVDLGFVFPYRKDKSDFGPRLSVSKKELWAFLHGYKSIKWNYWDVLNWKTHHVPSSRKSSLMLIRWQVQSVIIMCMIYICMTLLHYHVWDSHRAKFDDDGFNSFRGIASEGHTDTDTHGLGSTLKFAMSLTALETNRKHQSPYLLEVAMIVSRTLLKVR